MMNGVTDKLSCQRDSIGAYLDGELDHPATQKFEAHLKECEPCAAELRGQQQLLCTLNAAFGEGFDLPDDFARVVKTRAETNLVGVRHKGERRRALQLALVLGLASAALLGSAWSRSVLQPVRSMARATLSLLDFAWQTISDAAHGIAVIGRLSAQAIILSPYGVGLIVLLVFLFSIVVLPRLITLYHRTETIE